MTNTSPGKALRAAVDVLCVGCLCLCCCRGGPAKPKNEKGRD